MVASARAGAIVYFPKATRLTESVPNIASALSVFGTESG